MAGNDLKTTLLLQSDTTDGSTTIVDSAYGQNNVAYMVNANHSTLAAKFGATSIVFPAANVDSRIITDHTRVGLVLGSGDFTIDFWLNPLGTTATTTRYLFDQLGGDIKAYLVNNFIRILVVTDTDTIQLDSTTSFSGLNEFKHVALIREGLTLSLFIDGVAEDTGSVTAPGTVSLANTINTYSFIGTDQATRTTGLLGALIDELRVSKSIARWTSNFTPPTASYTYEAEVEESGGVKGNDSFTTLLIRSDAFDGSTIFTNTAYGDGSGTILSYEEEHSTVGSKFGTTSLVASDTTTGRISTDSSRAGLIVGDSDFAIDFWINRFGAGMAITEYLLDQLCGNIKAYVTWDGFFTVQVRYNNNVLLSVVSSTSLAGLDVWKHIALVKSGLTFSLYFDGVLEASANFASVATIDVAISSYAYIGNNAETSAGTNFGIDELRVSNGTPRWTSNFTPPSDFYTIDTSTPDSAQLTSGIGIRATASAIAFDPEYPVGIESGIGISAITGIDLVPPWVINTGIGIAINADMEKPIEFSSNCSIGISSETSVFIPRLLSISSGIGISCGVDVTKDKQITMLASIGITSVLVAEKDNSPEINCSIGVGGLMSLSGSDTACGSLLAYSELNRWC